MSLAECIHGLDEGLCDICYPKARPEPRGSVSARPKVRAATPKTSSRLAPSAKPVSTADRRLYRMTAIDDLEGILARGVIDDSAGVSGWMATTETPPSADFVFLVTAAGALAPNAHDSSSFEVVTLIGVANDPVRDRVRGILTAAGYATKVAVYPPWFASSD
ncbi:MAG: hypothetical protein EPN91_10215 [Salinibacterium sp.]|nr:MAG: hypothetical protein EPN91_10215 [Salinibacterium sp.]